MLNRKWFNVLHHALFRYSQINPHLYFPQRISFGHANRCILTESIIGKASGRKMGLDLSL